MAKVIVMDATRSECIEAIRQNKMKKSTYGSEDYLMYECGSDMGYYVQIQAPGSLETTLIEGSKPSTKTKSGAWGRVWYKGSYLKQFSGPLNVVRQELVKYLQQLTTDSHPLKTYKIKNHDSGKTYSVKAVNYTDAKMKYNKHILEDSTLSNAVKQLKSKYKVVVKAQSTNGIQSIIIYEWDNSKTDSIIKFVNYLLGNLKYYTQPKLGHHYRFLEWAWAKEKNDTTNDSLIEDADKSMGTYNGYSIKQNAYGDIYVLKKSGEKEFFESWKKAYEAIKTGAIKDSITEDAISKLVQNYLSSKNPKTKAEQDEIINFLLERNKITKEDVPKVRSLLKIVKDAITEDAETYSYQFPPLTAKDLEKANDYKLRKVKKVGEDIVLKGSLENLKRFAEKYLGYELVKEYLTKDSITEDADIAQNDIKSSYLPEDANADNIQYLGFNEKRKLSFYGYGDRYFVHYDLEGRTEEIDKATVQKILKKNILGEIDENDLINKEPQSEEIVSDAFEDAEYRMPLKTQTLQSFNPKVLIDYFLKEANHPSYNSRNIDVDTIDDYYTVFVTAVGKPQKPDYIKVEIRRYSDGKLVVAEKVNSYEQASQIMTNWKKKQERGDR